MWDSEQQLCATHAGISRGGPTRVEDFDVPEPTVRRDGRWSWGEEVQHARYPPCRCEAYEWPHRPDGGLCNWPDPPRFRLVMNDGKNRGSTGFAGTADTTARAPAAAEAAEISVAPGGRQPLSTRGGESVGYA